MAFLDKVTSSVQRLTRRVGGAGTNSRNTGHVEEEGHGERSVQLVQEVMTAPSRTNVDYSRMEKRNQKASSVKGSSEEWRRRENDLNETFRRKLDSLRQRWQIEKSKEVDILVGNLKKRHDNEVETLRRTKEKEMKVLRTQLRKSQEQLMERSRSVLLMNSSSQDSIKSTKSQDYSHSRGRVSAELANLRDQVYELQQTIKRNETESKRKDIEMRTLREQHDTEIQRMARDAQRHVKALLEELQHKERKIDKLQRRLHSSESNSTKEEYDYYNREKSQSAQPEYTTDKDMKSATSASSMSSSRSGLGPPTTISKDEYEKDKQRWQQRMSELESALKRSEETNADLAQAKAEMIRKNKDLEKVKKSLEEFNKKLTDRQKILTQETRQLEQKVKEVQDEAIRATQACETATLECNRLKEKRYNPDRDEELDRLRQQNLEYCKCIAALKQTILEKDRRLEVVQQKLRRTKRGRSTTSGSDDENVRSVNDLDFTASSMSLNTINEDYAEATKEELEVSYRQLANEHVELQNICSSMMRQLNTEGSNDANQQDLRNRLHEALQKIVQLERSSVSTTNLDGAWIEERMKYAALIRAMGEKIHYMEMDQERIQQELASAKEENELLEFQVLEMEHSQSEYASAMESSRCSKSQCDRSVSTSEDEGHFSMDQSMEESAGKELPLEELKIRFTLLKHRKELRLDDRHVVAQVKELWENLLNEHALCSSKLLESEIKCRDAEAILRKKLQQESQEQESSTEGMKVNANELQCELDSAREVVLRLQQENASLKNDLDVARDTESQLRLLYTSIVESEERERTAALTLRKQLEDVGVSRRAEAEILEQASRQQAQHLSAMRTKISDLEKEIDNLGNENRSLLSELADQRILVKDAHSQNAFKAGELERLRKMNSEYQGSLNEYKKMETCWMEQKQAMERKYADVKAKFKEAMKLIKEYEQSIGKYVERLKEAAKEKQEWNRKNAMQEKRLCDLERELETWNRSGKASRDDFMAYKEVEEQLKGMLKEKTNDLEEKCVSERKLTEEKGKLQRQLQHVKSYSAQLEKQFEVQIQIVQALKTQLMNLQEGKEEQNRRMKEYSNVEEAEKHVDAAHRLLSVLFPMCKSRLSVSSSCYCHSIGSSTSASSVSVDQQHLEEVGMELWNILSTTTADSKSDIDGHEVCVKLYSLKNSLDSLIGMEKEKGGLSPLEPLEKLCSAAVFYNERLSELRSKVKELEKSDDFVQSPTPGHNSLERIYEEMKTTLEKMRQKDSEAVTAFRSKIRQLFLELSEEDATLRTLSPSELCGSGTESEQCDRSPMISRRRSSKTLRGSIRSSSSDDANDKVVPGDENKPHPVLDNNHSPPSNVRLAADLRNGRYLICWAPPEELTGVQGYKVYVKDELKKHISSCHCSKTVMECEGEDDWTFINITTVYEGAESRAATIDLERSRKFIQNMTADCVPKSGQCEISKNHDGNADYEECSEV